MRTTRRRPAPFPSKRLTPSLTAKARSYFPCDDPRRHRRDNLLAATPVVVTMLAMNWFLAFDTHSLGKAIICLHKKDDTILYAWHVVIGKCATSRGFVRRPPRRIMLHLLIHT
ncbi:hypothetical protein F5B22DRAFT_586541 [Xylaria bambusicola]|uniref:uncharacterized protein n=1 Tax=Xylaria bambusicola TaxID=326684 RepID=UPI002008EAD0|nr:uncharacterized protein F5B22DRAFT_586541 [Xylaria bambusicola]KAI0526586.1 hypothetical protein F5B22DRAFT_586541 [Xylaria bambusicola]